MATNIVSYNWTTQFERAFKAPLDKQGFFESLSKAEEYLSKYADINVYDGQLMSIGTGEEASLYIVKSRYRAVGPATHFWDASTNQYRVNAEGEQNPYTHVKIGENFELVEAGTGSATHFWDAAKNEYRENAKGESNVLTHELHYFLEEAGGAIKSFSTADEITGFAVSKNIGKIFYVNGTIMDGDEVLYSAGPYVVTGNETVMKLATSDASGDLSTTVNNIQNQINDADAEVSSSSNDYLTVTVKQQDAKITEVSVNTSSLDAKFESLSNALHFLGNITTEISDLDEISDDNDYTISGTTIKGSDLKSGDIVISGRQEFVVIIETKKVTQGEGDEATEVEVLVKKWSLLGDVTGVQDLLTWQEED